MSNPTTEKNLPVEEKVPFGHQVMLVISKNVEELWKLVKEDEVDFPKFAFKVGVGIMDRAGPGKLLEFLGRNELKDRDLVQRLTNEAMSRKEGRVQGVSG